MHRRELSPESQELKDDWEGNNAAFTCPHCTNVFVVSELLHKSGRKCPECEQSTGYISGGKKSDGKAYIEY